MCVHVYIEMPLSATSHSQAERAEHSSYYTNQKDFFLLKSVLRRRQAGMHAVVVY